LTWGDLWVSFAVLVFITGNLVVGVIDAWWEKRKRDKKNKG